MAEMTVKLSVDSAEIKPLLGVCRLQAGIISEFSHLVNSEKIDELQRMFKAANLDEPLRKIQHEAFEAGAACAYGLGSDDVNINKAFYEWVNK